MTDPSTTEYVLVGLVRKPHGVRGEVSVEIASEVPGRFEPGSALLLNLDGRRRSVTVAAAREHKQALLVTLEGVEDRDAAEALRGGSFEVRREESPPSSEGSYYYYDLVGCRCHDRTEGDLGEVADVIEDGGGVLLEVAGGPRSLLLPFVAGYIRRLDLEAKSIEWDLPPGLVETCASKS